jgi:hypothetical protein
MAPGLFLEERGALRPWLIISDSSYILLNEIQNLFQDLRFSRR